MTVSENAQGWKRFLSPHYVAGKVREMGVVGFFKSVVNRLLEPVWRTVVFLAWVFPVLHLVLRLPSPIPAPKKRILAIWDFRSQPYSIGDLVLLHEVALVLCHQHDVGLVDICLLAEPNNPARPSFTNLNVNSKNYLDMILSLVPVVLAGQHIGELHYFDSHRNLEKYIADNVHKYYVWPSAITYACERDLNQLSMEFITDFYKKYHFIPSLSFRPALVDWAKSFLRQHVVPNTPIVVHLRNAGQGYDSRNSRMDAWLEFFQYCQDRFPAHFVVICAKREVDERLRSLSNVVIAKDFDTTVDQDLALIQCAPAYMGMSSGPSIVAILGQKPYSILNAYLGGYSKILVKHSWGVSFVFANEHQRWMIGPETTQLLADEFSRLFSVIDVPSWQQSLAASIDLLDDVPLRLK